MAFTLETLCNVQPRQMKRTNGPSSVCLTTMWTNRQAYSVVMNQSHIIFALKKSLCSSGQNKIIHRIILELSFRLLHYDPASRTAHIVFFLKNTWSCKQSFLAAGTVPLGLALVYKTGKHSGTSCENTLFHNTRDSQLDAFQVSVARRRLCYY